MIKISTDKLYTPYTPIVTANQLYQAYTNMMLEYAKQNPNKITQIIKLIVNQSNTLKDLIIDIPPSQTQPQINSRPRPRPQDNPVFQEEIDKENQKIFNKLNKLKRDDPEEYQRRLEEVNDFINSKKPK